MAYMDGGETQMRDTSNDEEDASNDEEDAVCAMKPLRDTLHILGKFATVDPLTGHRFRTEYRAAYNAGEKAQMCTLAETARIETQHFFHVFQNVLPLPDLAASPRIIAGLAKLVYDLDYYIDEPFVAADFRLSQPTDELRTLAEFVPQSALFSAAMHEAYTVVDILVKANVDMRGYGTLHRAPAKPVRGVCERAQLTVLSACVVLGLEVMARTLLQYGCDVNARNPVGGETALHLAVAADDTRMTALLLTYNACVGSKTAAGQTALHVAAAGPQGQVCASLLLGAGADVNAVGVNGKTPLHVAFSQDHKDLCVMLLEHGANVFTLAHYPPHGWFTAQDFHEQAADKQSVMVDVGGTEGDDYSPQDLDTDCTSVSQASDSLSKLLHLVTTGVQHARESSLASKAPVPAVFAHRLSAAALVPVSAGYLLHTRPLSTTATEHEEIGWFTMAVMREITTNKDKVGPV
jgi:ankyrin repeat protein